MWVKKPQKECKESPERVIWGERWLLRTQDLCSYIIRDLACSIKTRMPLIVPRALWHPGSVWHPCLLLSLMAFCLLSRRGDQECLGHEGLRVLAAGIRCHSSVTPCRGECFVFVSVTFFFISSSLWFIVWSCVTLADSWCCFALGCVEVYCFGHPLYWFGPLDLGGGH